MDLNAAKARPWNIYMIYDMKRVSLKSMNIKINEF